MNILTRVGDETHVELKPGIVAKFDSSDYDAIFAGRPLYVMSKGYAARNTSRTSPGGRRTILAHHEILKPAPGMVVDHINRDKLDNRRKNLRPCTYSQNRANVPKFRGDRESRFKGVRRTPEGRWQAKVNSNRIEHYLGTFPTETDAAHAYNDTAKALFGEFALLNNLDTQP